MAFSSLTPEQQAIVAEYTRQQRATVGEFASLLNHMAARWRTECGDKDGYVRL